MIDDARVRNRVERDCIAVAAAFRHRNRLRRWRLKRMFEIARYNEHARKPCRSCRMRVAPHFVIPGDDLAVVVERSGNARALRGSVPLPAMLLLAHPPQSARLFPSPAPT